MRESVDRLFPGYSRFAYRFLKIVLGFILRRLYTVHVEGIENVPGDGAGILASNHISFIDSLLIPLAVPRRVTYLAKAEYWDSWKTRWFFDTVGQIPVRREDGEKAQTALDAGIRVLEAGGLMGIYPEGTRSPDGRLRRGKTGVARLAQRGRAPVLPVGVAGTREIMPKGARLPRLRGEVWVRFGDPLPPPDDGVADPLALRSFVDGLMYEIMRLSGQEYVDRYADRKGAEPAASPRPEAAGVR